MDLELKLNEGVLFPNRDKKEPKHPDLKGELNVDGTRLEVAVWIRTSKRGSEYWSLKVGTPRERPQAVQAKAEPVPANGLGDEPGNDLPF